MKNNKRALQNKLSNIATIAAVVFGGVGVYLLLTQSDAYRNLGRVLVFFGCLMFEVGFWCYLKAKGYHPAWVLLSVCFGPMALLVFMILPDRGR